MDFSLAASSVVAVFNPNLILSDVRVCLVRRLFGKFEESAPRAARPGFRFVDRALQAQAPFPLGKR